MSEALFPAVRGEEAPAVPGAEAPAVQLSREQILEIEAAFQALVRSGDALNETLKALLGPQPGKLGEELLYRLRTGTGQHRLAKDTIGAMLKQLAKLAKQLACPHDQGYRHSGRDDAFCKVCGWPFERVDRNNFLPLKRMTS